MILKEREDYGEFLNFDDFIYRLSKVKLSQKMIEYLIKAGVMDRWGTREGLIALLPQLYDKYRKQKEKEVVDSLICLWVAMRTLII